jgi:hypothetical protein
MKKLLQQHAGILAVIGIVLLVLLLVLAATRS